MPLRLWTPHRGEGKTSASDNGSLSTVLHQTYSPKFSDFAIEFYSFVADNYAPFYSTPIECTERDAPYVLDGLLYKVTYSWRNIIPIHMATPKSTLQPLPCLEGDFVLAYVGFTADLSH